MLTPLLAAALALQDAPARPAPEVPADVTLESLPIDQAAAARCAIAYATVSRWQKMQDARGKGFPDIEAAGGREFFVRVMAKLMEDTGLTRDAIVTLSARAVQDNEAPDGAARIKAMMPACELMKSAAGL